MPVKDTVCRTPSFVLTRDMKVPAKATASDHVLVVAGLHRQWLRWHGWKGKCFWYLTDFKMRRKRSEQNICLYYWLIIAVFHRERASRPCLMTDTGNITTDEADCNTGSDSFLSYKIYRTKAFVGEWVQLMVKEIQTHSVISEEPILHLTLIFRAWGTQRPLW